MIKTTYQTPELRDSNDNIVQEGAFGKNTALSNSDNTGWIDYVVNNLEALHDSIGDSAATLDGNGHVVEPANLAIGDEDGVRLKTGYLKLTGGTVTGITNFQQNVKFQDNQENVFGGVYVPSSSSTEQYAQFYGGENTGVAGAKLTLYPAGDGRFKLDARSTDGSNTYTLVTDNNGNLNWRGYPLAWKKDYLPLAGGTMTGNIKFGSGYISKSTDTAALNLNGGSDNGSGAYLNLYGKSHASSAGAFSLSAYDGTTRKQLVGLVNGKLTWDGNDVALSNNVLALSGGTMTGATVYNTMNAIARNSTNSELIIYGGAVSNSNPCISLRCKERENEAGSLYIKVQDNSTSKIMRLMPDGTFTWGEKNVERVNSSGTNYIRYENGLQICWRNGANFDTNGTQIVLPVPFKDATYAVNVTGRGLTTSTNIAVLKVTTKDSAGFVAMAVATANISSFSGGTLDYIAIGLWK